jgi:hypothetical protein
VNNGDTLVGEAFGHNSSLDLGFISNQEELLDLGISFECHFGTLDHHTAPVVASHDIHHNAHKRKERRRIASRRAQLKMA